MKKQILRLLFILALLWGLYFPLKTEASSDTTFILSFQLDMSKAVKKGIFFPGLDRVYIVFDSLLPEQMLVRSGESLYTLAISDGVDSAGIYHFRFRINNTITETISRQIQANPGINQYNAWWDNDWPNTTWFRVDMSYMVQKHLFRPDTDFVDISGSMNNWQGSAPMTRIDTTLVYQIMYNLEPWSVATFKFRINGDTSLMELKGRKNRYLYIPDTILTRLYWYDNYNPARIPMTFYCNMKYMTRAGHLSRQKDYVDVAGSFNGNGAWDILYDDNRDSIYNTTLFIDTSFYSHNPVSFKYRINGKWASAELPGQPMREYILHDTVHGPNIDSSWFNNWNPGIPTPPFATQLSIQGKFLYNTLLSGIYTYENINGIPEDSTTSFQWYRCSDSLGINLVPIDSATKISWLTDTLSIHQWIVFEVTPRAKYGDSAVGKPARVITKTRIGSTGIEDHGSMKVRFYPNPFSGPVNIESIDVIDRIEIYDLSGHCVLSQGDIRLRQIRLNLQELRQGIYLLKAYSGPNLWGEIKIVRM